MKTYTIIGGVNGTGKSSLTGILRCETDGLGIIIDVNNWHGSPISNDEAVRLIDSCIEKGICFTQETTLSGHKTAHTAKKALENGYHVRLYYIGLNTAEESLQRIQNRVANGGHDIPPEDVFKRFASRFSDVAAILPYCHEAKFYDNHNGFAPVAQYKNGEFSFMGNDQPKWIHELCDFLSLSR